MVPTTWVLFLSAALFAIGVAGVLVRRNAIVVFMSIELMLNAGNVALVAFSRQLGSLDGQVFVFFVLAVAAAEAAGPSVTHSLWQPARSSSTRWPT